MKFGINQAISQTITQLSCIQLETPSSRLWNFWWINDPNYTYDLFGYNNSIFRKFISISLIWQAIKTRLILALKRSICDIFSRIYTDIRLHI